MERSRKVMARGGGFFSAVSVVGLFVGLTELLLALRVFLEFFFTISGRAGFVHWAFATTNPLLSPFRGIFVNPTASPTRWYVDFPVLFAMAAYVVFWAWMLQIMGLLGNWRVNSQPVGNRK